MRVLRGRLDGATDGAGGVRQYGAREAVEAGNVYDRIQHGHVFGADIGRNVAGGDGRGQYLRYPDRQRAHRRRPDGGAGRATQPNDAIKPAIGPELGGDDGGAARHRGNRRAAISPVAQGRQRGAPGLGDGGRAHVGRKPRLTDHTGVDHDRPVAARDDDVAHEAGLVRLGIERREQRNTLSGGSLGASCVHGSPSVPFAAIPRVEAPVQHTATGRIAQPSQ